MAIKIQVVNVTKDERKIEPSLKYRVIAINGIKVQAPQAPRKIFIDSGTRVRFWYQSSEDAHIFKYNVTSMGYQAITLNGVRYEIYPNNVVVEIVNSDQNSKIKLEEGKVYRLQNGTKIQIVAKVPAGDFASEPMFVAVYKNGTARYSLDGHVLSHGGDLNWTIVSEWKNIDLWTVTVQIHNDFQTHTFQTEQAANNYIRNAGGCVLAKTKVSI